MINKLRKAFELETAEDTQRILNSLDAKLWYGSSGINDIIYASVASDGTYWIADDNGNISYSSGGPAMWVKWSEDIANIIGVEWGDYGEEMRFYKL